MMQKNIFSFLVMSMFIFWVNNIFAAEAGSFLTASVSPQSYHSASSTTPSSPVVQSTTPVVNNMGGAALNNNTTIPAPNFSFELKTQHEIKNLMSSNRAIAEAIQNMRQNISMLQAQIVSLSAKPVSIHAANSHHAAKSKSDELIYLSVILGVVVLLLLLSIFMGRLLLYRKIAPINNKNFSKPVTPDDDLKTEYDFMNTDDAIPAQLDLARAYISMHDHAQAKTTLELIMQKGNAIQKKQAEILMQKMFV